MLNLTDVETIAGIIAAAFTVVAAVLAVKKYRQGHDTKALDLRRELQGAFDDLDLLRRGLEAFLESVNQSHVRILAARGQFTGGAGQIWRREFADDQTRLRRLLAIAPHAQGRFELLSLSELDAQLALVNRSQKELKELREKYERILQQDNQLRR